MSAILPRIRIDHSPILTHFFMPYQIHWIRAEDAIHAQGKRAFALAEKSIRIGWTFADAFKNVRKRLRFKERDYLFATKDYPSALEYMRLCRKVAELFNLTGSILSHGEEFHKVPRLDDHGRPTGFTDEIKMGVIKFDNRSRILAFSSHPQAMAVYAGDVGLDEFAKHPNAHVLWETAQGRVTWGFDMAVWSSHDGEDTLFHEFAQEARTACQFTSSLTLSPTSSQTWSSSSSSSVSPTINPPIHQSTNPPSSPPSSIQNPEPTAQSLVPLEIQKSKIEIPKSPWNLYYRVTLTDAIELGLLDVINRVQGASFTPEQFVADCRARSRHEEIFQQAYLCNPRGASTNHIVDWSAIERCRYDYDFSRLHLEHDQVIQQFGEFRPERQVNREHEIADLIRVNFAKLLDTKSKYRLGFDVAASGQGDLAVIYIDELKADDFWLRGLFTCRTEDWHFLKTVLFCFLQKLKSVQAAGDQTGLGKQICWEAAGRFGYRFTPVNFSAKKHDLGFALMNQLATAQKRFPKSEQDIAADFFALRKSFAGSRWAFSEGRNSLNPVSHCDIAWAAALATEAHNANRWEVWAAVG